VFTDTMGWAGGWSALSLSSAIQINPRYRYPKGACAKYVDYEGATYKAATGIE